MILALECSAPQRSAAVAHNGTVLAQTSQDSGPGTAIFGLIESVLREGQVQRDQIECLVVGLGPGSYTGIRSAIAAAQGWELARSVPLLGISSMDALARVAWRNGLRGRVALLVDAQRDEFYVAEWDLSDTESRPVSALRLATRIEIETLARTGIRVVGPCAAAVGGLALYPAAAALAELATGRTDFVGGESLEPIYLRPTAFVKTSPPSLAVDQQQGVRRSVAPESGASQSRETSR